MSLPVFRRGLLSCRPLQVRLWKPLPSKRLFSQNNGALTKLNSNLPIEAVDEQNGLQREEEEEEEDGELFYKDHLIPVQIGQVTMPKEMVKKIARLTRDVKPQLLEEFRRRLQLLLVDRLQPIHRRTVKDIPQVTYNEGTCLAFLKFRMPGTYAAIYRCFSELQQRLPTFRPRSLLDFGSGTGSGAWAATEIWNSFSAIHCVDPSPFMYSVATKMLEDIQPTARMHRYIGTLGEAKVDLALIAYVLSELPNSEARKKVIQQVWSTLVPGGVLVLLDAGSEGGFAFIKSVRSFFGFDDNLPFVAEPTPLPDAETDDVMVDFTDPLPALNDGELVAPCPHAFSCPMPAKNWCHFSQRIRHDNLIQPARERNWSDEKFSYLIIRKKLEGSPGILPDKQVSRVLSAPLKRGGHVLMDVCTPAGTFDRIIPAKSHGKEYYTAARKARWGDLFAEKRFE